MHTAQPPSGLHPSWHPSSTFMILSRSASTRRAAKFVAVTVSHEAALMTSHRISFTDVMFRLRSFSGSPTPLLLWLLHSPYTFTGRTFHHPRGELAFPVAVVASGIWTRLRGRTVNVFHVTFTFTDEPGAGAASLLLAVAFAVTVAGRGAFRALPLSLLVEDVSLQFFHWNAALVARHSFPPPL